MQHLQTNHQSAISKNIRNKQGSRLIGDKRERMSSTLATTKSVSGEDYILYSNAKSAFCEQNTKQGNSVATRWYQYCNSRHATNCYPDGYHELRCQDITVETNAVSRRYQNAKLRVLNVFCEPLVPVQPFIVPLLRYVVMFVRLWNRPQTRPSAGDSLPEKATQGHASHHVVFRRPQDVPTVSTLSTLSSQEANTFHIESGPDKTIFHGKGLQPKGLVS
jgi:hypothetical protein